ncbi:carboxymuconolactone decarboxylase family protein [Streptomyces scopuliridis]|uniref:4-carboxymuconolactone decarboxylase n=1 Tax=Streptomyces scopuliridis RB72 TaxID=1440053 RepID=A0A2T7T7S5_9ACTN|nr:carboxymuconolactone decarboxylase family protein [Streptomyces scopuliridis]PVE11199.1 4-carboxymuconolactone decarboxylase [Streptomyces scopuliridis RB72]
MAKKQSAPQELATVAPKLVEVTDQVLFGDVWERSELSPRDRSLITVTALAALYRTEQLGYHLKTALENGLTKEELAEALTHLAFYAGWPNAMSGVTRLKNILDEAESSGS